MIAEGDTAPAFELPAVVEGDISSVSLESYLGSDIVLLVFYPADFNPACEGGTTDLDELDLFTMQKDVSVLGVSADSVYSHRAFAEEFDLHVPLLADTDASVAAAYGVDVADPSAGYRNRRAVFVIEPQGDVAYVWATDDLEELPPTDAIRSAVDDIGGTETALARYRVGHAHYIEGRRVFTSAMRAFEQDEWMLAQSDFNRAYDELDEATEHFNSAVRFGEDDLDGEYYQLAEEKGELLSQAAEWLTEAASAYASGEGAEGEALRADAERTLEDAREVIEPIDPDEFPPDEAPADRRGEDTVETASLLPEDEEEIDTSLEIEFDDTAPEAEDVAAEVDAQDLPPDEPDTADEAEEAIDDAELEEITAELEEQTEAVQAELGAEDADETATSTGDVDEEALELDLTDPTGGEGLDPLEDEDEDEADEPEDDADEDVTDES